MITERLEAQSAAQGSAVTTTEEAGHDQEAFSAIICMYNKQHLGDSNIELWKWQHSRKGHHTSFGYIAAEWDQPQLGPPPGNTKSILEFVKPTCGSMV